MAAAADVSSSVDRVASNKNAPGRTRAVEVRCRRRDDDKMAAHVDRYRYIYARHGSRPTRLLPPAPRSPYSALPHPLPAGGWCGPCVTRHCRIYSGGPLGIVMVYRVIGAAEVANITYYINLFKSIYNIWNIYLTQYCSWKIKYPVDLPRIIIKLRIKYKPLQFIYLNSFEKI